MGLASVAFPVLADMPGISLTAIKQFQQIMSASPLHISHDCAKHVYQMSAAIRRSKNRNPTGKNILHFTKLKILNPTCVHAVTRGTSLIRSYLTGGNMTIIQSSIGTPWAGCFKNKILFLEDKGEAAYRVDRALWQMQNADVFKGIKALVLGDFVPVTTSDKPRLHQIFQSFAERVTFPVITGVPCGHGRRKSPLPFMTKCILHLHSKTRQVSLLVHSPFKG